MSARIAALVLAAGRSSRFRAGDSTKAVAEIEGVPLVRMVAMSALRSQAASVTIITGHARAAVETALQGLDVRSAHNADFKTGIAGSLKVGVAALPDDVDGVLVMLADMPFVRSQTLDTLIVLFDARRDGADAIVPVFESRHGNPVLLARSLFVGLQTLSGDEGARRLLSAPGVRLDLCAVDDPGVTIDVDTQAALEGLAAGPAE